MPKLLHLFRRSDYQSEFTQFIEKAKVDDPQLEARQRAGRAIWWDKAVDRDAQADWKSGRVAQKPYVYGSGSGE